MNSGDIWLIGTGPMAIEYTKVLKALGCKFVVIGRSQNGCKSFFNATGISAFDGGLDKYFRTGPEPPAFAIVAVAIESLTEICIQLMQYGAKRILLEKPGVEKAEDLDMLTERVIQHNATVVLAYNRRFYASVLKAQDMIKADGGVRSFQFEFTEWGHQVKDLNRKRGVLENWFLGNSTHVIDTAFYLCGKPREICCYYTGGSEWHSRATIYAGAGVSENDSIFSYSANWEAPGRWSIEIMTDKNRYIFKPMEKLQIMKIGSVNVEYMEGVDYSLDEQFKPGLYLQVKAFLDWDLDRFINIPDQKKIMNVYRKMSGY